ncbi:hypothetical protein B5P46_10690 [Rhizobium leguminosarum]|uniref:Uncharacterized protein n=1 Tax=Rhizobium leguminosarum TaxID=384 RepID=A0A4Q1UEB6_RHILE|nr:DUF6683 family protein [Rhizobium leguminosarum]RXT29168.1 hypothetical protein B5P46_10690 [Rhizobium leguminosarum]
MNSGTFRSLLAILLFAYAGSCIDAGAQDSLQVLPNDYIMNDILNQQRVKSAIEFHGDETQPRKKKDPLAVTTGKTSYVSSQQVSLRVRQQFADNLKASVGVDGARLVADALKKSDPVAEWAAIVGGDGLRPGDVADVVASYWILNWVMANGSDSTDRQAQAVREQIRPIIAANTGLNDAQRQEIAEVLILNFLMQRTAYVNALNKGDAATARKLGDAAVKRFSDEMAVDLKKLELTDNGFIASGPR